MTDYRSMYKKYFNIDFGKDFEVHHIDFNRANNDINNLVLLPKKLHKRCHFYYGRIYNRTFDFSITTTLNRGNDYLYHEIDEFLNILYECNQWYDYKRYLMGQIPNIHNIKIQGLIK